MNAKKLIYLSIIFVLAIALTAACGGTTVTEEPIVEETTLEEPTELNIAVIFISVLEEPWGLSWMQSVERVIADAPYGLPITIDFTEDVWGENTERVLRDYAESGKYGIIWAHSSYPDEILKLSEEYPDILWVGAGAPNESGGNKYFVNMYVHETAYLEGMIAGLMTETNVIGSVAAYPIDDVNVPLNGFLEGAKAVNPEIEFQMTYIESWFDPAKTAEATYAQIAAGADFILAERFGVFDACAEKGVYAFGHLMDQNELSPDVVVTSTVPLWDPSITFIIDEWWNHATTGEAYDAPVEQIWYK